MWKRKGEREAHFYSLSLSFTCASKRHQSSHLQFSKVASSYHVFQCMRRGLNQASPVSAYVYMFFYPLFPALSPKSILFHRLRHRHRKKQANNKGETYVFTRVDGEFRSSLAIFDANYVIQLAAECSLSLPLSPLHHLHSSGSSSSFRSGSASIREMSPLWTGEKSENEKVYRVLFASSFLGI